MLLFVIVLADVNKHFPISKSVVMTILALYVFGSLLVLAKFMQSIAKWVPASD